jgi:hypothetical protein
MRINIFKNNSFINIISLLIILGLTSCVGEKAGQKTANCADGSSFNAKTQQCEGYSASPASSLSSIELTEDFATKTVTLTYTDINSELATTCNVTDEESNIELVSPRASVALSTSKTAVDFAVTATGNIPQAGYPTEYANATSYLSSAQAAYVDAQEAQTNTALKNAITDVAYYVNLVGVEAQKAGVQSGGQNCIDEASDLTTISDWVGKRCYCSGGVCTTELSSDENVNGVYGFEYSIGDSTSGLGSAQAVAVDITAVDDAPFTYDYNHAVEAENTAGSATSFTITMPEANDYDSLFFTYSIVTNPANGTLNCTALSSPYTCTYTETTGDNGVTAANFGVQSSKEIYGVTYTANSKAASGDNITVIYKENEILNLGTVSVAVSGTDITVYMDAADVTTAHSDIATAINNHEIASSFVSAAVTTAGSTISFEVSHNLENGKDSFDSFTYVANDGFSNATYIGTVSIDIELQDDLPVNDTANSTPFTMSEDTDTTFTLAYTDAEGDSATSCAISDESNVLVSTACACAAGTCTVTMTPTVNHEGTAGFKYTITNASGTSTSEYYGGSATAISVIGVNDEPMPSHYTYADNESSNSIATTYSFTIPSGYDAEGSTLSYDLVSTTNGTVNNCLGEDSSASTDIVCDFTPTDGNVNGVGTAATITLNNLTINSKYTGSLGNSISFEFIDHTGVTAGNEFVTVSGQDFKVYIDDGVSTEQNVIDAINNDTKSALLVSATTASAATVVNATAQTNLATGTDGGASFTYKVTDASSLDSTYNATVNIDITSVDDPPVLCAFDHFSTAPECGLNGCIGTTSPIGNIVPRSTGVIYYYKTAGVCYKSNGTSANTDWEVIDNSVATNITDAIKDQTINQGASVAITNVRIDEGGSGNEDTQTVTIDSVTSSNTTLVPLDDNNIRFYYDGTLQTIADMTAGAPLVTFDNGGASEDEKEFKIEIVPQAGLTGTSTLVIEVGDSSGASSKYTFDVTVADSSATHESWVNIVATGPKVDKFLDTNSSTKVCNYSETKCNIASGGSGYACTGSGAPSATDTIADQVNAIYYDSTNDQCYYATGTSADTEWTSFDSYCGISPSDYETSCSNASCIGDVTPVAALTPVALNSMYYDKTANKCYRSIGYTNNDWEEYYATAEVELQWNAFTILPTTSSVTGYNVYRRLSGENFDYSSPINKTTITTAVSSVYTFVDNATNSRFAPIPRTVYYYEVRPIILDTNSLSIETGTSEAYAVVRVTAPDNNRAFVHRWIVNQTVCNKIHTSSTDIDGSNDFRCPYAGPGDSLIGGTAYYDFGKDLIVDRYEAACPYTLASDANNCGADTADGSCLSIGNPNTDGITAPDGAIYYDRGTGSCYTVATNVWTEIDSFADNAISGSDIATRYALAEQPPMVNISQERANRFCGEVETQPILGVCEYNATGVTDPNGATAGAVNDIYYDSSNQKCYINTDGATAWDQTYAGGNIAKKLPTRKDQMAYTEWDTDDSTMNDSVILNYEVGLSLNVSSKCNSTSASGLTGYYSDADSPSSNSIFTLPGSDSSGIRSLMSASSYTDSCQTRYGVQDTIGNVSEWTVDRMVCDNDDSNCTGLYSGDGNGLTLTSDTDFQPSDTTNFDVWRIGYFGYNNAADQMIGPCSDTDTTAPCDTALTDWTIDTLSNSAGRMAIPMGLLIASDYNTTNLSTDTIAPYMLLLNNSSGLTAAQTHKDTAIFNTATINADATQCGGMAAGGSYLSGTGAGQYHQEFIPCDAGSTNKRVDVGFRCVAPVTNYIE